MANATTPMTLDEIRVVQGKLEELLEQAFRAGYEAGKRVRELKLEEENQA